jgi:hypothetical protein
MTKSTPAVFCKNEPTSALEHRQAGIDLSRRFLLPLDSYRE